MASDIKPMHINMSMLDFFERRNENKEVPSLEKINEMIKSLDPDGSKVAAIHKKILL